MTTHITRSESNSGRPSEDGIFTFTPHYLCTVCSSFSLFQCCKICCRKYHLVPINAPVKLGERVSSWLEDIDTTRDAHGRRLAKVRETIWISLELDGEEKEKYEKDGKV